MKKIFLNWKQNGDFAQIQTFVSLFKPTKEFEVVIFLPAPYISFANSGKFELGGQNISSFPNGAYTGEIGGEMLANVGAKFVLIGHSERRTLLNEGEETLTLKLKQALKAGLTPVLCIGEKLNERKDGTFFAKLKMQMKNFQSGVLIAYEPVWAIGTGLLPKTDEISEVAEFLFKNYGVSMLYGGSVSEENIKTILAIPHVSGVLVGGASLDITKVNKMLK